MNPEDRECTLEKCENCQWFFQCGSYEPCEYYDPIDPEESRQLSEEIYLIDTILRGAEYEDLVEEEND